MRVPHETVDLTPAEASQLIQGELVQASEDLGAGNLDAALDGYTRALGLALQLGPAPTEQALAVILQAARQVAHRRKADSLSSLGPAIVGLVEQVREASALPPTKVMTAWAIVAADLGAFIGQVGLALTVAPDPRVDMLDRARARAALLDDATNNLFDLTTWLDEIQPPSCI